MTSPGGDGSWQLFCGHVLFALIEHAPARARLEIAADSHSGLQATAAVAAAATAPPSSWSPASPAHEEAMSPAADMSAEREGVEKERNSTVNEAGFVVRAIYGRLEAARKAAVETAAGGGVRGGSRGGGRVEGAEDVETPSAVVAVSA